MSVILSEVQRQATETRGYLDFLERIDSDSTRLRIGRGGSMRHATLEPDIRKMLRATYFLVGYGAIESIVRFALSEAYDEMARNGKTILTVKPSWQKSIVKLKLGGLLSEGTSNETVFREVATILDEASRNEVLAIGVTELPISGNVDHEYIREHICRRYGVTYAPPPSTRDGVDLRLIRQLRNALAHGSNSFTDVGRDHLVRELKEINGRAILYLTSFARRFDRFLATSGYAR